MLGKYVHLKYIEGLLIIKTNEKHEHKVYFLPSPSRKETYIHIDPSKNKTNIMKENIKKKYK